MNENSLPVTEFELSFPRANSYQVSAGVIKREPDDFYVEELFDPELSGAGEHVWIWLEKKEQNTEFVAKQLARFAGVRPMDVGYSGLKDRWAQTRQWFSIYLGNKAEPDWFRFEFDGVTILRHERHSKKLRRGEHSGNRFRITVTELAASQDLEAALESVRLQGFPNYFGLQRFGREAENLKRGQRYFLGEIKASRSQRGFYLSAARSYLYNLNLAAAIEGQSWLEPQAAGPLFGDPQDNVSPLSEEELQVIDAYPVLKAGLHKNRLRLERRDYCVRPGNFSWALNENEISLSFDLPTGVFATSLLDEIFDIRVAEPGKPNHETAAIK